MFLYQEDSNFDLAGHVVQVRDAISPKKNQTESLDGARVPSLSDNSAVDVTNRTYSDVVMGLSKNK
jgi:hypothetical protein